MENTNMRKNGKKFISAITSIAMAVTMLPATVALNQVKAEETNVELKPWSVYHSPNVISGASMGNVGVVNSFVTSTGESAKGLDSTAIEQTVSTTNQAEGFTIDIANTGWEKDWENDTINPWSVKTKMDDIDIKPGHMYSISFKASASKKKYAYIYADANFPDETVSVFEENSDIDKFIVMNTSVNTYTVNFTNWVGARKFTFGLLLGSFNSYNDFDGSSLMDKGLTEMEVGWSGIVNVSEFSIVDMGLDPKYEEQNPEPVIPTKPEPTIEESTDVQPTTSEISEVDETTTTKSDNAVANNTNNNVAQPTTTTNVQPKADITELRTDSKVEIIKNTKAKVKSVKPMKKSLKLSWKKSKEADGYQVQISLKTSFAKARTINVNKDAALGTTIKGLKAKKKYYIRMRSYVVANGTKVYSKWSKVIIKKTK